MPWGRGWAFPCHPLLSLTCMRMPLTPGVHVAPQGDWREEAGEELLLPPSGLVEDAAEAPAGESKALLAAAVAAATAAEALLPSEKACKYVSCGEKSAVSSKQL